MSLFTSEPGQSVGALGEVALIEWIGAWLGPVTPPSPAGIGDDCAVIPPSACGKGGILATTDGVLLGRHFTEDAEPERVAGKLLKRNLSDIAAMGGSPGPALVALVLSRRTRTAWLQRFYEGLAACAKHYGVPVVGGDVAQGPDDFFSAHVSLLGAAPGRVLTRHGARKGDALFVTGELGGSLLGHHFDFQPRLEEGRFLAEHGAVRSCIDVTDGLAKDLRALLPGGTDAALESEKLPVAEAARELARGSGRSPLEHALCDGEDYELLFTLDARAEEGAFLQEWEKRFATRLTRIGTVCESVAGHGQRLLREGPGGRVLCKGRGYEHLR